MKNLTTLVAQAHEIERMILEANGELTSEIEAMLDLNNTELAQKVDSYAFLLEKLGSNETHWKAKAAEYSLYAKTFASAQSKIKEHLKNVMIAADLKEIIGEEIRYTLRPSTGSLVVDNINQLENKYLVITTSPNNIAIKKDISEGKDVPGAHIEPGFVLSKYFKK